MVRGRRGDGCRSPPPRRSPHPWAPRVAGAAAVCPAGLSPPRPFPISGAPPLDPGVRADPPTRRRSHKSTPREGPEPRPGGRDGAPPHDGAVYRCCGKGARAPDRRQKRQPRLVAWGSEPRFRGLGRSPATRRSRHADAFPYPPLPDTKGSAPGPRGPGRSPTTRRSRKSTPREGPEPRAGGRGGAPPHGGAVYRCCGKGGEGPEPEVEAKTPVRGLGRSPGCGAWGGAPGAGVWGGAPVVGRGGVGKGLPGAPSGGSRCPGSGAWRSRRRPR